MTRVSSSMTLQVTKGVRVFLELSKISQITFTEPLNASQRSSPTVSSNDASFSFFVEPDFFFSSLAAALRLASRCADFLSAALYAGSFTVPSVLDFAFFFAAFGTAAAGARSASGTAAHTLAHDVAGSLPASRAVL